eukprot:gene7724-8535_t
MLAIDEVMELSALERRRLENIARNNRCLRELGLAETDCQGRSKRAKVDDPLSPPPPPPPFPLRRSSRLAGLDHSTSSQLLVKREVKVKKEAVQGVKQEEEEQEEGDGHGLSKPKGKKPSSAVSGSSSSLFADVALLLQPGLLGRPLDLLGKAAVMQLANRGIRGNGDGGGQAACPRFSKLSGVTEWRNAIFLWINLEGETYANAFSWENIEGEEGEEEGGGGGRRSLVVTWFASNRMQPESRVVQRLLSAGQVKERDLRERGEANQEALLFARRLRRANDGKAQEGYACLGRLRCLAMDCSSRPLALRLELLDTNALPHTAFALLRLPDTRQSIASQTDSC